MAVIPSVLSKMLSQFLLSRQQVGAISQKIIAESWVTSERRTQVVVALLTCRDRVCSTKMLYLLGCVPFATVVKDRLQSVTHEFRELADPFDTGANVRSDAANQVSCRS